VPDFGTSRVSACFAGIRRSDTKIQGPSAVDSGYKQTPMPDGGGFRRSDIKNSKTFGGRFGLPTNSNARRWRIPTNVPTRMKSLNLENDLWFLKP
jgi:hypothetical protein